MGKHRKQQPIAKEKQKGYLLFKRELYHYKAPIYASDIDFGDVRATIPQQHITNIQSTTT